MKVLSIDETPNPNARKFIVDEPAEQTLSFFNAESAKGYELAERLFTIPGVSSLLFLNDFITINKSPGVKWVDLIKAVKNLLET